MVARHNEIAWTGLVAETVLRPISRSALRGGPPSGPPGQCWLCRVAQRPDCAQAAAARHADRRRPASVCCRPIGGSWQSRPTMSVAIGEAPKRRRRFPEQVLANSVGSMLAHKGVSLRASASVLPRRESEARRDTRRRCGRIAVGLPEPQQPPPSGADTYPDSDVDDADDCPDAPPHPEGHVPAAKEDRRWPGAIVRQA